MSSLRSYKNSAIPMFSPSIIMPLPLTGKVAVVTGSSRSIGAAIVRKLASDGANVVVNFISNAPAAEAIAAEINAAGAGRAICVQANATNISDCQKLLDAAIKEWGRLDILVLNAALVEPQTSALDIDEKFFDDHFSANVKAPLFMVKEAASLLRPGKYPIPREAHIVTRSLPSGGRIIFFSTSLTANSGITPNFLIYAATKGSIEQITRALAKDFGTRGITVNCVSPGPIDTELFRHGKPEHLINTFEEMHPVKRLGKPDEVSSVVAFLTSDGASWVNGQTLMVNGVCTFLLHVA